MSKFQHEGSALQPSSMITCWTAQFNNVLSPTLMLQQANNTMKQWIQRQSAFLCHETRTKEQLTCPLSVCFRFRHLFRSGARLEVVRAPFVSSWPPEPLDRRSRPRELGSDSVGV